MNFILRPSLEQITFVKIATSLWNQYDIKYLITKFCIQLDKKELIKKWLKIEGKVIKKIPKLPLPKRIKERMLGFIKPIGLQILYWIQYHNNEFGLKIGVPDEFYWTAQGKIDKKKMAEIIIKDKSVDIATRYKLACIYCLENDTAELYNKNYRKHRYRVKDPIYVKQKNLVDFWTNDIKQFARMYDLIETELENRGSLYQYAFEIAAIGGNKVAAEYFLNKLTSEEKKESLVRAAVSAADEYERMECHEDYMTDCYCDTFCLLLSNMDEEQQTETFKIHPYPALRCFLNWPRQPFFAEITNRTWSFLHTYIYVRLLNAIFSKVLDGYKDFDYHKLFRDNWQQCPDALKRSALNADIISKLFKIRNETNIKMIFQDLSLTEKSEIIYTFRTCNRQKLYEDLMYREEWDLLELLIKECLPSKNEIENFKDYFYYIMLLFPSRDKNVIEVRRKFVRLLDDLICRFNKRKCVENECSEKKLCTDVMKGRNAVKKRKIK